MENSSRKPLRLHVAGEIRAHLGRQQMSGAKLAQAIDRSEMYVSRRLNGRTSFDLDDLEKIANVLGVAVSDLLPAVAANTLRNHGVTKKARSRPMSTTRTPHTTTRPGGRPGKTSPKAHTRRPAMIPRPLHG